MPQYCRKGKLTNAWAGPQQRSAGPGASLARIPRYGAYADDRTAGVLVRPLGTACGARAAIAMRGPRGRRTPWTTRATAAATAAPTSMLERPLPFSRALVAPSALALDGLPRQHRWAAIRPPSRIATGGRDRGAAWGRRRGPQRAPRPQAQAAALWCAVLGGAPGGPGAARTLSPHTAHAFRRAAPLRDVPLASRRARRGASKSIPEFSPSLQLSVHILTTNSDLKVAHKLRVFARSLLPLGHVEGRRQNNDGECQSGDDALG